MVVLITGISLGFGRAMARGLSAEGHTVYGTHRNAVERIPEVVYLKADVTDDEQVNAAVDTVLQKEGRIDVSTLPF